MTPKKKALKAIKAKIREIIRNGGATPEKEIIAKINVALAGWVNYFRVGNSNRAFSEVRDYLEMKVRTLLTRRKRRRKRSVGWLRWSNVYLHDAVHYADTVQTDALFVYTNIFNHRLFIVGFFYT